MSRFSLLALAVVLPLAACGDSGADDVDVVETDPVVTEPMTPTPPDPMAGDAMTGDAMASDVTVQGTIDALSGGVTSLPVATATTTIDGWISQLEGNAAAEPIVENLRQLRTQLTSTPLDGNAIGQTLVTLGEQTTGAAGTAPAEQQDALRRLGSTLTEAGNMLTGM